MHLYSIIVININGHSMSFIKNISIYHANSKDRTALYMPAYITVHLVRSTERMKGKTTHLTHDLRIQALMTLQWTLDVYTQLTLHTCGWANFTSPDVFPQVSSNQSLQATLTSRHFSPFRSNQTDWCHCSCVRMNLQTSDENALIADKSQRKRTSLSLDAWLGSIWLTKFS